MNRILLPRLQNRFFELVDIYLQEHDITQKQLANLVGIHESHLSALKHNASQHSKRILSVSHIFKFILRGVFSVEDIYDGRAENDRERGWWEFAKLIQPGRLLEKPDKELEELSEAIFPHLIEGFFRFAKIDPRGKTEKEIQLEIVKNLMNMLKQKDRVKLLHTVDHTGDILDEARNFVRSDNPYFACLFYALWFEHWLNGMIHIAGKRLTLSDQETIQIIRETNFRAKSTWLLRILGLKPINETHLQRMQGIIDSRNSFVHYKWKREDLYSAARKKNKQELVKLIKDVEETVSYLLKLEDDLLYNGKKETLPFPLPKRQ